MLKRLLFVVFASLVPGFSQAQTLPVFDYLADQAAIDSAFAITDLSQRELAFYEIRDHVMQAAATLHVTSIEFRANSGDPISNQNADWLALRAALLDAGYAVQTNQVEQTATVSW